MKGSYGLRAEVEARSLAADIAAAVEDAVRACDTSDLPDGWEISMFGNSVLLSSDMPGHTWSIKVGGAEDAAGVVKRLFDSYRKDLSVRVAMSDRRKFGAQVMRLVDEKRSRIPDGRMYSIWTEGAWVGQDDCDTDMVRKIVVSAHSLPTVDHMANLVDAARAAMSAAVSETVVDLDAQDPFAAMKVVATWRLEDVELAFGYLKLVESLNSVRGWEAWNESA